MMSMPNGAANRLKRAVSTNCTPIIATPA